ncbi:amidase, partial [Streptomyces sp. SID5475]|nr:amidase [Streptomyces sp. SID5475]
MLEQAAAVRDGELSPVELTEHYLRRVEHLDASVGAYLTVTADRALDGARRAERLLARHAAAGGAGLPPLLGVPLPVKDLDAVPGVRCTYGSAVFAGHTAPEDEEPRLVALLREAGTVLLGKTNTPEFGLPAYTEGRVGPPARSPYDPSR